MAAQAVDSGKSAAWLRLSTILTPGPLLRRRLVTNLILGGFIVLLAGGEFAAFESRQVSNQWEGLWWALSLMTTVGFVGEAPESLMVRLLSSILMMSGFALMEMVNHHLLPVHPRGAPTNKPKNCSRASRCDCSPTVRSDSRPSKSS